MNRRQFGTALALSVPALAHARGDAPQQPELKFRPMHAGRRPEIGMLLYPGLTLLDLLGPQTALSTSCNVHLVWKSREFIESDTGIGLRPTATLADCPKDLDALFIGGGPGQMAIMNDPEPPFHAGTPRQAGPEVVRQVREWLGPFDGLMRKVSEDAARSMPK